MYDNIGIFINNTNSELNFEINLHNYNILKNNFKKIIIIDLDNIFSKKLKTKIFKENNNVVTYITHNDCVKNNLLDLSISPLIYLFNIFEITSFDNDNIILHKLSINKILDCNYIT
jgi:hypothetical protein